MPTVRLFVAVAIPADCRASLQKLAAELRHLPGELHWVKESQFHITLAFLGAMALTRVPAVGEAVSQGVSGADRQPWSQAVLAMGATETDRFRVNEVLVMRSDLGRVGASYTVLARIPLWNA